MNRVDFDRPPTLGTVLMLDDQPYELIEAEEHRRKDGSPTTLLTWLTTCPTCEQPFEVKSGLVCKAMNRRCDEHRKTGKPVKGRRSRSVRVRVLPA